VTETFVVGSHQALAALVASETLALGDDADVVLVPTGAAFTGLTEAAVTLSSAFDDYAVKVEALMVAQRHDTDEPYFARRLREADLVVLGDGSALHARTVWRATPVGEAIRDAPRVVAVGAVASVLGEIMVDPRGGAPTTGLGYRRGLVTTTRASDEQLRRTRSLLGDAETLAVLGPAGVVHHDGERWRALNADVKVTRGDEPGAL